MQPILIIEDDLSIREALTLVLNSEGYSVTAVENGQHALDLLLTLATPPSLILLDLNMPVMDGNELLNLLKSHSEWKSIPVALFSGVESRLLPTLADVILHKPIHLDHLLETVSRYVKPDLESPLRTA